MPTYVVSSFSSKLINHFNVSIPVAYCEDCDSNHTCIVSVLKAGLETTATKVSDTNT